MSEKKPLSSKDRKRLEKQRKNAVKQAQKYHKEQEKKSKKSSRKTSNSKIEAAINSRPKRRDENLSREEKFRRESEKKIRNLKPKDYDDGYYIDEYGERKKQERRAKEIHDQEKEVIRRRKKSLTSSQVKHRRIAVYSAIFAVVLIVGAVLCLTVLFKTEKITVEGNKYYSEEQIIAFSGVEMQENIFIAAITGTPEKITENLSYIEDTKINFSVPDTVIIKITNAVPAYVIKNGSNYLLVSTKGRILEEIAENKDKLPELKCDKLKSTKVGDYVSFNDENVPEILEEISESIRKNKVEKVVGFDVSDTSQITLDYDHRIKINIGLPEDIDYKIRTAMAIINEKLDPNGTGTISGTLDVSACSTTKVSHFKPAEPTTQPTTQPSTTAPVDSNSTGIDDNYTWDDGTGDDSYSDDSYSDGSYSDNSYADDTYTDDSYADGAYTDDSYSDGYSDSSADSGYSDEPYYDDSYSGDTYFNDTADTGYE